MEKNKLERYEKQYRVEIDSYRESGKTDDEIYTMIRKIEKRLQISKVKNLITVLQKKPDCLSNIKALMDYRNLRVLQVYYGDEYQKAKNSGFIEYGPLETDILKNKAESLDKKRRETHNKALGNFCGLLREYRNLGVPPFHIGEYMDPHYEKNGYGDPNIRRDMTDSLFSLLNAIEDVELRELEINSVGNKDAVEQVKELRRDLNSETRGFKMRLNSDEDNVEYR